MSIDRSNQNWPEGDDSVYVREAQTWYFLKTGDPRMFHELPAEVMSQLLRDAQEIKADRR